MAVVNLLMNHKVQSRAFTGKQNLKILGRFAFFLEDLVRLGPIGLCFDQNVFLFDSPFYERLEVKPDSR